MTVFLEVAHVVGQHPPRMVRPIRLLRGPHTGRVFLQPGDHLIHLSGLQRVLELLGQRCGRGRIFPQCGPSGLIQVLDGMVEIHDPLIV